MAVTQANSYWLKKWCFVFGLSGALSLIGMPAHAVVKFFDGFGDADRNNDGVVDFYDTDVNLSGTWNDPVEDAEINGRGLIEVTAATDPGDVGIVWSGIRSFDTTANLTKSNIKIINDNVATGSETSANLLNDGLALSVEPRGGGSTFIGKFPESVEVGPVAGDKLVVSVDFRVWKESTNALNPTLAFYEFKWGLFEDTDNEFGTTAPYGNGAVLSPPGEIVEWGLDDGNWFASQPGAEGDKGIYTRVEMGYDAFASNARINWEYNVANINGSANNGRILEGSGVSSTPGSGGDVGTLATPTGDGPGGVIQQDLTTTVPHKLSMEFVRLADGLLQIATFVDDVELLRDEIKTTDTGFSVLGPPAFSYDYVAFRNSTDIDFVIDNFALEIFGSNAVEVDGDFDNDGDVDGRDFLIWQRGGSDNGNADPGDLALWQAQYGGRNNPPEGLLAASVSVPEPGGICLISLGLSLLLVQRKRLNDTM